MNTVTCSPEEARAHAHLYQRLDRESDSVRMLTFVPTTSTHDVHCQLHTVSWRDRTTEYNRFISASSIPSHNQRQRLQAWIKSFQQPASGSHTAPATNRLTPGPRHYRFTWGDYATLSYVWGTEPATETITVNGFEVKVRPNLASALRALAADHRFDAQGGFHIWIDALCIHQCDLRERNDQVARMKHMYGMAWNVISWLGAEADNSQRAFPLLARLAAVHDAAEAEELRRSWEGDPIQFRDGCWLAMHELIRRAYWCRLWVVQELALGNTSVTIRCGDEEMDWETFISGIQALHEYFWLVKDGFIVQDMVRSRGHGGPIDVHNQHLLYRGIRPLVASQMGADGFTHAPLTTLLDTAASCRATQASDKVYGMMAMMDPDLTRNLAVDYDLAPREVFASLARTAFTCYKNLELLRECNLCPPEGGPTWAPDWTWLYRLPQFKFRREYRANGGRQGQFEVDAARGILTCEAVLADVIDGIGARRDAPYIFRRDSIEQSTCNRSAYGGLEDTRAAFAHAIVGDLSWQHRDEADSEQRKSLLYLPRSYSRTFFENLDLPRLAQWSQGYFHIWQNWRHFNRALQVGGRQFDDYFSTETPRHGIVEDHIWRAQEAWNNTMLGRRFATTRNGLFGWVPDLLKQPHEKQVHSGDLVAIILGCTSPIILRPSGDFYQVVGEAYFLGLMDGEGIGDPHKICTIKIK
ncbi:hypothetical protein DHEL01_v209143 [Diaporthe helianthi]|uniref:Heterokaryon incompatibility domain-containing protein n=1 Tax=Diaporthe helianthi TaxID=158607 RepID=A0A2P5HQC2_DIAHE|nr:hypothetical protein DHEL01_v209143 [Diaporthe helianthi]